MNWEMFGVLAIISILLIGINVANEMGNSYGEAEHFSQMEHGFCERCEAINDSMPECIKECEV